MPVIGKTFYSSATLITNTGTAVPAGGLIGWNATDATLKYATLSANGTLLTMTHPGYYEVVVKFNSPSGGPTAEQESAMNYILYVDNAEFGNTVLAGEALIGRVTLNAGSTIGIKNKASVTINPSTVAGISWFTVAPAQ